jgi:flagellar motor switch protein FliG
MDMSEKLVASNDNVIQQFLRKVDSEKLAVLMAYHLSDEAADCILKNMSERAQKLVLQERDEFKGVAVEYEKLLDRTIEDFS